jgi:hypothetical protein
MVPPESLSQYLSNECQCYGVSIDSSNYQYFCILILVTKVDLRPKRVNGWQSSLQSFVFELVSLLFCERGNLFSFSSNYKPLLSSYTYITAPFIFITLGLINVATFRAAAASVSIYSMGVSVYVVLCILCIAYGIKGTTLSNVVHQWNVRYFKLLCFIFNSRS